MEGSAAGNGGGREHRRGDREVHFRMAEKACGLNHRLRAQLARLQGWRNKVERLLVIEVGAGTAIPSVRLFGEGQGAPIIRINPGEANTNADRGVSLAMRGIEAMQGIALVLIEQDFLDRESCRIPKLAAKGRLR